MGRNQAGDRREAKKSLLVIVVCTRCRHRRCHCRSVENYHFISLAIYRHIPTPYSVLFLFIFMHWSSSSTFFSPISSQFFSHLIQLAIFLYIFAVQVCSRESYIHTKRSKENSQESAYPPPCGRKNVTSRTLRLTANICRETRCRSITLPPWRCFSYRRSQALPPTSREID